MKIQFNNEVIREALNIVQNGEITMNEKIVQLSNLIKNSNNTVFFGGAGVSTESGVPDFRSENGIFKIKSDYGYNPEEILSHGFFYSNPTVFYSFYRQMLAGMNVQPNAAHIALAKWEQEGKLQAVITQNIDGLHQVAGSKNVIELHGSSSEFFCSTCGNKYPLEYILLTEGVPMCQCGECNGIIRPDVILYHEMLRGGFLTKAKNAVANAEVLIVGGTSLLVHPAAGLIDNFNGHTLVLINKAQTPYDNHANLVIHDSIGKVLGAVKI